MHAFSSDVRHQVVMAQGTLMVNLQNIASKSSFQSSLPWVKVFVTFIELFSFIL